LIKFSFGAAIGAIIPGTPSERNFTEPTSADPNEQFDFPTSIQLYENYNNVDVQKLRTQLVTTDIEDSPGTIVKKADLPDVTQAEEALPLSYYAVGPRYKEPPGIKIFDNRYGLDPTPAELHQRLLALEKKAMPGIKAIKTAYPNKFKKTKTIKKKKKSTKKKIAKKSARKTKNPKRVAAGKLGKGGRPLTEEEKITRVENMKRGRLRKKHGV